MTLKRHYWDLNAECCITCMFIDEYALNVNDEGDPPLGYDGTAMCDMHDHNEEESETNRLFISPLWKACPKYKRCTEAQADYLEVWSDRKDGLVPNPNPLKQ